MRDDPYSLSDGVPWSDEPRVYFVRKRSVWLEYGRPALLFVLTATTIYIQGRMLWSHRDGLILAAAVLAILFSHEMGHYLACRYYGVDATLPHFLPAPFIVTGLHVPPQALSFIGTFGAFIRIRGPIPDRRALFDIGVAGPLAGFLVCLPIAYLGLTQFDLIPIPTGPATLDQSTIRFGDPLLLRIGRAVLPAPEIPAGMIGLMGPYGLAAWFGLFLTALNLIPVGQLDGGHATYALLRRHAWHISRVASWVCVGLIYFGPSWILWSLLLRLVGRPHPPTIDDDRPVGRGRAAVGLCCLAVLVLCFMPSPIEWSWHEAWVELRAWMST